MAALHTLIDKATAPTLTADNWQFILDVCDQITSDPETETAKSVLLLKTKITSTKDANTILRSLSLLVAMAENCGSRMKQEIASKSFTQDCLIKKLLDKKLHITVKLRIVEVVQQLSQSFSNDPSLKPMKDAHDRIKLEFPQLVSIQQGPTVPAKEERTAQDKNKEDEELQRVLKLSLQEFENEQNLKKQYLNNKPLPETSKNFDGGAARADADADDDNDNNTNGEAPKSHEEQWQHSITRPESPPNSDDVETVATVSRVRALYDLISYEEDELSFKKGDVITVIESVYRDWWRGSLPNGKVGIFPLNYVTPIVNKSPRELKEEIELESKLLNVEHRKIDRLLALLSVEDILQVNEAEVTQLYNEIITSRNHLSSFIDKYSQRKEELGVLYGQLSSKVKAHHETLQNQHHSYSSPSWPGQNTGGQPYNHLPYPTNPSAIPLAGQNTGSYGQQQQQQQQPYHPHQPQQSFYTRPRQDTGYPLAQSNNGVGYSQNPGSNYSLQTPQPDYTPHPQTSFPLTQQPQSQSQPQPQQQQQQQQQYSGYSSQPPHEYTQQQQSYQSQPQFHSPQSSHGTLPMPAHSPYPAYGQDIQPQNTSYGFGNAQT